MIQCLHRSWTLFSLALLAAAPLASQLIPLGPEFRINEADVHVTEAPALALDASGRLLAAWPGPGSESNDILVRFFERDGEPAGPMTVIPGDGHRSLDPAVAILPSGRFAVAWTDLPPQPYLFPTESRLYLRLLDAGGSFVGAKEDIDSSGGTQALLAARPSGGLIASWELGGVGWRFFDADGRPEGSLIEAFVYLFFPFPLVHNEAVVALDDGSFQILWTAEYPGLNRPGGQFGHRLDATGHAIPGSSVGLPTGPVAVGRDGHLAVAWAGPFPSSDVDVWLDFYDTQGRFQGPALPVAVGEGAQVAQAAAMDEDGRILVVWSNANETPNTDASIDSDLFARLFAADGTPLGPAFPVATDTAGDQVGVKVIEQDGDWVVSWVTETSTSGGGNLFARRFATCDGPTACLGGRFRAEVAWKVPGTGQTGSGQAVPLTGDTSAFWFFGPENIELVVKAIDGRTLNDHFWIFYGALSDVEYDLTVTDVVTGERKVYHNPAGTMASHADTRAFQGSGPPLSVVAPLPAPESAAAEPFGCPPVIGFPCLHGGRFSVDVDWRIPGTGQTGSGQAVGLTSDSASVWFFNSNNVELLIKILDGTAVNGKFWVFYGALSDVEYTVRVTDHMTGKVKTYHNPAGTMASRADTSAF